MEWEPGEIRWYVDSNLYQTHRTKEWYSSCGPSPAPFNKRFHILLNVAVGGNFDGDPDGSTTFPQTMMVDYVRVYNRAEPQSQNLLANSGFETGDLTGCFEWNSSVSAQKVDKDYPRQGSYKLTHWASGAYQQITAQKVNVPNGLYKASVWARSSGGQKALKLYVKDYGGAELSSDIGTSTVTEYRKYTIDNIQVTNGQIEIGIWNDANANNWAAFDGFELVRK